MTLTTKEYLEGKERMCDGTNCVNCQFLKLYSTFYKENCMRVEDVLVGKSPINKIMVSCESMDKFYPEECEQQVEEFINMNKEEEKESNLINFLKQYKSLYNYIYKKNYNQYYLISNDTEETINAIKEYNLQNTSEINLDDYSELSVSYFQIDYYNGKLNYCNFAYVLIETKDFPELEKINFNYCGTIDTMIDYLNHLDDDEDYDECNQEKYNEAIEKFNKEFGNVKAEKSKSTEWRTFEDDNDKGYGEVVKGTKESTEYMNLKEFIDNVISEDDIKEYKLNSDLENKIDFTITKLEDAYEPIKKIFKESSNTFFNSLEDFINKK